MQLSIRLFVLGTAAILAVNGAEMIFEDHFDKGAGHWYTGKNQDPKKPDHELTYHRNLFGHKGESVHLEWSQQGGRSGGFATSVSPWYFDDNHAEFYWLHLIAHHRTEVIPISGKDFRNTVVKVSLRGRDVKLNGTKLFFWVQGPSGAASYYTSPVFRCWALTSVPLEKHLTDGEWHDVTFRMENDESLWSFMGLINGGLKGKIKVTQALSSGEGTLGQILGGGKLYNWGFILCNLDPNNLPSGKIDFDEFSISSP